jgi:hypothetical protein
LVKVVAFLPGPHIFTRVQQTKRGLYVTGSGCDFHGNRRAVRSPLPGEGVFRAILPEEIDWQPFAAFPPSVRLAVVVGQPFQDGPYTMRVKVPGGVKLMPHRHPEDRIYTVISGIFFIGLGDHFDADKLIAYPPGAVIILPGNTSHFHWEVRRLHHAGHGGWAPWP